MMVDVKCQVQQIQQCVYQVNNLLRLYHWQTFSYVGILKLFLVMDILILVYIPFKLAAGPFIDAFKFNISNLWKTWITGSAYSIVMSIGALVFRIYFAGFLYCLTRPRVKRLFIQGGDRASPS